MSDFELAKRSVVRYTADKKPGFPCRVSLQDAEPGETLLLLNYEHLPVASPYRSRHAIFVREHATEVHPAVNELPEVLASRLLSLRSFDAEGMMRSAEVVEGCAARPVIDGMLADPAVEYIHVHNAKRGCFAARIDRA
jgi:hypothetical protein